MGINIANTDTLEILFSFVQIPHHILHFRYKLFLLVAMYQPNQFNLTSNIVWHNSCWLQDQQIFITFFLELKLFWILIC